MNAPLRGPPYNPIMLRWAREWRGRTLDEAASKLKQKREVVASWENNEGAPTVRQARQLADFYARPFLEFFLSDPPEIPSPKFVPDFRMHAGMIAPTDNWELRNIKQWCETQRINALDLYDQIGERPKQIPASLFADRSSKVDAAAKSARTALSLTLQVQVASSHQGVFANTLREGFENIGILTLKANGIARFGVRGICIAEFPLPVIVFSEEAPTAQAFTLAHELGHVLIRQSGITGFRSKGYDEQPIERWCDRFAASFLMPQEHVTSLLGNVPIAPSETIEDAALARIADAFGVSAHAMLIRLVHLGYVTAPYYWDVKKPEFDAEEAKYKRFGRSKYYGSRYRARLGALYTGLVLQAWMSGRITNHNAAEYMGIKNLSHLHDIRNAAFPSS